jgi:hypothetical protein
MGLQEEFSVSIDWTHLACAFAQWWALVNTIINFGLHKMRDIS